MKLFKHQQRGLRLAVKYNRYAFFWDTGTGKSLLGLSIIRNKGAKTLVVAPKFLLVDAWLGDAKKFYPDIAEQMTVWHNIKSKQSKTKELKQASILLINYESLLSNKDILTDYGFSMLILDESQKLKNPQSRISKTILKYAKEFEYIYLLTGTPAPNNELEYYTQLKLIAPDEMPKSWYIWRQNNFNKADFQGWKWRINAKGQASLQSILKKYTYAVKKEDVIELKGQFYRFVEYEMSTKELKAYKEMLKNFVIEIENEQIEAKTTITKLMKLRQVLSGFIYDDNNNTQRIGDSKLKVLVNLLNLNPTAQYLIWIQYKQEAIDILSAINNAKAITGETPQKEREQIVDEFRNGKLQYLIAHPKTIGHGTTFVNIHKAIYYSLSYSYEEFKQSQDRIYRYGQSESALYYILQAKNYAIDKIIWKIIQEKGYNMNNLLDSLKEIF